MKLNIGHHINYVWSGLPLEDISEIFSDNKEELPEDLDYYMMEQRNEVIGMFVEATTQDIILGLQEVNPEFKYVILDYLNSGDNNAKSVKDDLIKNYPEYLI